MERLVLAMVSMMLMYGAAAGTLTVPVYSTQMKVKQSFGSVTFSNTQYGMLITPNLRNLPAGIHGFHIHTNPSCANQGLAAGGHYDPQETGKHLGPYDNSGHLGDLPALVVDPQGNATLSLLAPRMTTKDLPKHALMIHAGGDNYSDEPIKLGGGGKRIACGVVSSNKSNS